MKKWADYLISEVSYDSEHLISIAIRHKDTDRGITKGIFVDRLTIASDIKNGFTYITIYSGINSWKHGNKLRTFSIGGSPYLRIDKNKVKLDYLGDLPESSFVETAQELELQPEPITESEEEATPEQLSQVKKLEKEIRKLEAMDVEHEIIQTLRKQNKKLDDIENKLHNSDNIKNHESSS